MERLLADAEKISGVKYDISSYADIIDAIHVVQENMGITGTTAKEAEHTIEGSLNSTKAAWENLMVAFGTGKDVKKAFANFTKSAKNVLKNVLPIVKNALVGLGEFITELAPVISDELPGLIETILPPLLNALGQLIAAIVQNLPGILRALWNGLKTALQTIWESLKTLDWIELGKKILTSIVDGLKNLGEKILGFLGVPTGEDAASLESDWSGIAGKIGGWIISGLQAARDFVLSIFGVPTEGAEGEESPWLTLAGSIGELIVSGLQAAVDFIASIFAPPDESDQAQTEKEWGDFAKNINDAIDTAFTVSSEIISGVFTAGQRAVENFDWDGTGRKIGKLASKLTDLTANAISKIFDLGNSAIATFPWEDTGEKLGVLAGQLADLAVDALSHIFTAAKEAYAAFPWEEVGQSIGELSGELVKLPINGLSKIFTAANSTIRNINWEKLGEKVAHVFDGFVDISGDTLSGIFTSLDEVIRGIDWTTLGGLIAEGLNRGLGVIADIGSGVLSLAEAGGAVVSGAGEYVKQSAIDWVNSWFGNNETNENEKPEDTLETLEAIGKRIKQVFDDADEAVRITMDALYSRIVKIQSTLDSFFARTYTLLVKWPSIPEWIGRLIDGMYGGSAHYKSGYVINPGTNNTTSSGYDIHNMLLDEWLQDWDAYKDHASAMENGEILRGLTPFGIDRNGTIHRGGEAGDEAVVGVSSLRQMVFDSAASAIRGLKLQVVLDSGVLVGEIAPAMNDELNAIADWNGGGHA